MPTTSFGPLDWPIAGLALALMLGAGLSVRRYVGSLEDYLVAKRGLGPWVGAASLVSTEIGIITYMYQAQFGFLAGFSAFAVGLLTLAVCLALGRTGFVITRLREMGIMTVPEYLERRYDRGVRVLAGVLMAVGGSLNLGIFPLIEARFLAIVTGLDPRHVAWAMAGLLLVALVYTAIGGMVSLIVTNYVQYVLLAAGTVAVTVACLRVTSLGTMTAAVRTRLGAPGFDPLGSPQLGLAFLFWQLLLWTALMTVWQSVAMRTFSTRDAATGRKVFTLTSVLFLGRAVIPMAWGIAALAFFSGRAEPRIASPDPPSVEVVQVGRELARDARTLIDRGRLEAVLPRVERLETLAAVTGEERYAEAARTHRQDLAMVAMPWMLARILPTGIIGLVMAGMLAASLSTYAGYFLGWSAVLAQDVAAPLLRRELSGRARLWLTRTSVVALTVFIAFWSLVYRVPGPAYFYLQVTANLFMAPTLVTVVAGLYWRRASSAGAYLSFLLGAATSLAYLVPALGLGVAAAGNLSWGLAALGFVMGSLAFPPAGARAREAHP
jgi:SSS family solute:Na+ symporter